MSTECVVDNAIFLSCLRFDYISQRVYSFGLELGCLCQCQNRSTKRLTIDEIYVATLCAKKKEKKYN